MNNQKKHDPRPAPAASPARTSPAHDKSAPSPKTGDKNEGEGSRTAARQYDAEAERAAKDPKRVEELAKKAKDALEFVAEKAAAAAPADAAAAEPTA